MKSLAALASLLLALGCGPAGSGDPPGDDDATDGGGGGEDRDGDGWAAPEDCNDESANMHPGQTESCNGLDDDCSGRIDDPFDVDMDFHTTCNGDCDDMNPAVYGGAPEEVNGLDEDCDGIPDNHRPDYDDDGDGWTDAMGDCDDDEPYVNPGAVEVAVKMDGTPELVDNDCDGLIDEAMEPCDGSLDPADPYAYARAMELCNWVTSASITAGASGQARGIVGSYGSVYVPHAGASMGAIASGIVGTPPPTSPQIGTQFGNTAAHPDPRPDPSDGCGSADPATVNDYIEVKLEIDVPSNAKSFSYDFNFMSAEYPEWVCTQFDDTFIAYLSSSTFTGNISFDAVGKPVTINIGFFTVCDPGSGSSGCTGSADLAGTGYDGGIGGGTGWLTTTAPVVPGEHITLRFIIFDEGDFIYDSVVLLDNFRWQAEAVDGPVTVP